MSKEKRFRDFIQAEINLFDKRISEETNFDKKSQLCFDRLPYPIILQKFNQLFPIKPTKNA